MMPKYACGFRFTPDESVILIRKTKPEWQVGKLNGVGGRIEPGEGILQAMAREFEEETSVQTKPDEWEVFCLLTTEAPGEASYSVAFCRSFGSVEEMCATTEEVPYAVKISSLQLQNAVSNLHWLIPLALDKIVIAPTMVTDTGPSI